MRVAPAKGKAAPAGRFFLGDHVLPMGGEGGGGVCYSRPQFLCEPAGLQARVVTLQTPESSFARAKRITLYSAGLTLAG